MSAADGDRRDAGAWEGPGAAAGDAFEHMPVPMAATEGPEHTIVAANAACRALTREPDLVGCSARQVFPALAGEGIADLFDLVFGAGEPFRADEWPAGPDQYVDLMLTPWRDSGGGVRGVLLTAGDVTGRVAQRTAGAPAAEPVPRAWLEATAVQEALLPSGLPVLPQVRIAARYVPAAAGGGAAGGDWFDALILPGGQLALMVGGVPGGGVAAAAAAGRLRAVLRQALTLEPDLDRALAEADQLAASDAVLYAATLGLVVLETAGGQFRYATCGHPPPLVASPDGTARRLPGPGAGPLGTAAGAVPATGAAVLARGEVLLLYGGGLIAGPGRTLDAGLADLEIVAGDVMAHPELAAGTAATPAERVSQLTVELLSHAGYPDDVTALAVWRQPEPHCPLDIEAAAVPDTVAALRRALDGWLDGLGVAFGDRQLAELSVTEAVANAVEHAYPAGQPGAVRLEAAVAADGYLQTRVSDRGRWRPPGRTVADRGQGLALAVELAAELRVTHPPQDSAESPGSPGTVIAMRHRLRRLPVLAPLAAGRPAVVAVHPVFAVDLVTDGPAPRLRVSGPVDLSTADQLAGRLFAACQAGLLPLTVELSAVTLLSSAGVRLLYQVQAQLRAHGQPLTLVSAPGSPAAAVLRLARLLAVPR